VTPAAALRVALPARSASLHELLERFTAFAKQARLPAAIRREIHLALDEIVSNIINHGGDGRRERRFEVDVALEAGVVRVTVVDDGRPFDPLSAPKPAIDAPLADRPIGGLGVYLVRELMDRIEYTRRNGRNHLRMERRLPDSKVSISHENTKTRKRKPKEKQ